MSLENVDAKVSEETAVDADAPKGEDAEFMGDAPGADKQSCVPTLKVEKKAVNVFVPPAPKKK